MKFIFIADPMCSWCYGFTPVMDRILKDYPDISIDTCTGKYLPDKKEPISEQRIKFMKIAWETVEERTGQPFNLSFKFIKPEFIFNTHNACIALNAMKLINPELSFKYLKQLQYAFFIENSDITDKRIVTELVKFYNIPVKDFSIKLNSKETISATQNSYERTQAFGVKGLPTLLGEKNGNITKLSEGYHEFETLKPIIDNWVK